MIKAAERIAECRTLVTAQPGSVAGPVLGIIADLKLQHPQARRCLTWFAGQLGAQQAPALFLTEDTSNAALREARAHGAIACLPDHTEPRVVVAALIRLVFPIETVTDHIVRRGAARTSRLL
ncbi:hypothetical protein [uncultured Methylobacterium sp.]|uniref:hypothetical protein n=1 Tax=uncultured Methylobacterium sp. TaxID=157278 RepID=UPI0025925190|nr:hypothetical protein [uncultured Methylobacterium sp.]